MNEWHVRIQRSQQLATCFSKLGYNTIYINPGMGRQFDTPYFTDRSHRISTISHNLFELHIRLPREPVFHHRTLTANESNIINKAIGSVLSVLPAESGIQIVSLPIWMAAANRIRKQYGYHIIYDCHDLLEGFASYSEDIILAEKTALEAADLIIFSSTNLLEHHTSHSQRLASKSILIRNAIDESLLNRVYNKPSNNGPPVIGYVGAIEEWLDVDIIKTAALAFPYCIFRICGKVENNNAREELNLPNVELPGEIAFSDLAQTISEFDVGIIPFVVNSLTLCTNPIKLYEYFGYGLPVVSTPLPEVSQFNDLVYIGQTPTDFSAQLKLALAEADPERRSRRRAIASKETWLHRANVLAMAITQQPNDISPGLDR
jgi:glycosyltransferase involved in cell wall biosynthesis